MLMVRAIFFSYSYYLPRFLKNAQFLGKQFFSKFRFKVKICQNFNYFRAIFFLTLTICQDFWFFMSKMFSFLG